VELACSSSESQPDRSGQARPSDVPGRKDRKNPTSCQERYVAADVLERQVEELYERTQLLGSWVTRLREELHTEMATRSSRNAAQRTPLVGRL
jgi:uncharacterized small protein (DUF1192 family)